MPEAEVIQKWPFIRVGRYGHFQTFWTQSVLGSHTRVALRVYMARQLYKNICMLFLFPVKVGKLSTVVNATFDASCYS